MNFIDSFQVKENKLSFSGKDLNELAEKYGTPLIVYSRKIIEDNIDRLNENLNFNNFSLHYAMKANYNPALLSIIRNKNVGIDAANFNEVSLALRNGFKKESIIASPNNLDRRELLNIKNTGVTINFDDVSQFEIISDSPPDTVSFRINPGIGKGEFEGTTTGGKGSKFGIPPDIAINGYKMAIKSGVRRFGIHMMTGSNVLDATFFRESIGIFFSIASRIANETGIDFDFIDIGGGFGVPYRTGENPLDIKKLGSYISENISKFKDLFKDKTRLIAEPGRYIIANSAIILTKVTSVKSYDKYIIGTDTGMNILIRPALYGAVHPIISVNRFYDKAEKKGDIVGQICENTDRIGKDVEIQKCEIGDILAILNGGAYVASMSSNYNLLPRASEILIDEDRLFLIRRKEELDDMISTFIIPEHLKLREK